jgi:hypothetical protein
MVEDISIHALYASHMLPERAEASRNQVVLGMEAAARLIEIRAAAIRRGFPALDAATELELVAEAIRKRAARLLEPTPVPRATAGTAITASS